MSTPVDEILAVDVLVIGAGNAGLRAGVAAAEAGAATLLVSKSPFPGGASVVAGGIRQAAFHPDDSPDLHFLDTVKSGKFLNDQGLVRILVEQARERVLDLESYGVAFMREGPDRLRLALTGGGSVPRGLHVRRNDRVMRLVLARALRAGVRFRDQTMVTRIVADDAGVIGATALNLIHGTRLLILCHAIVNAAGAVGRLYQRTAAPRNATGDGFALVWDLGVELIDLEFMQFIPTAFVASFIDGMTLGEGSVWGPHVRFLNGRGERYLSRYDPTVTEYRATRDILARANYMEALEGRGTPNGAILIDATESDPSEVEFQPHSMGHRYRLLRHFYGPEKADLKEPIEAAPSALYLCGGIRVDEACRTGVPGLFACGEVMGGVHGANRLNGNSLIDCEVFGRIAGIGAAQAARGRIHSRTDLALKAASDEFTRIGRLLETAGRPGPSPSAIKHGLQETMWHHMGIVRSGEGLARGLERISELQELARDLRLRVGSTRYNYELQEALEVPGMLRLAEAMTRSALFRTESRGNHYRTDFPRPDDARWLVHTRARWQSGGWTIDAIPVEMTETTPQPPAREQARPAPATAHVDSHPEEVRPHG